MPPARRGCQFGVPLSSSRTGPAVPPAPGQRARVARWVRARWRPEPGWCSAPGPSARIFVVQPLRSIAPSPSPAAGKGHRRTGGGGEARGNLVLRSRERPSHPCLSPSGAFAIDRGAHSPARLAFLFLFYVSLMSTFSLSAQPDTYLFFAFSPFLSRPSSFFLLSVTLFVSQPGCLSHSAPSPPGDSTPSSLPADNSWVHTCPQRGGLTKPPSLGCMWGCRKAPHCHFQGPGCEGWSSPGHTGEGAADA